MPHVCDVIDINDPCDVTGKKDKKKIRRNEETTTTCTFVESNINNVMLIVLP